MAATSLAIKLRCTSWEQLASLYERDIKNNRFFLKSPHPPDPGTEIKLDLTLPSGSLVPLTGRVARVVPPPRGPGVELVLLKVPNSVAWLIESALASARRAAAPVAPEPAKPAEPAEEDDDIPITEDEDAAAEATIDLVAALEAELASMHKMNPFQVLGVGYEASDPDVRAKFGELSKKYHPDRFASMESERARALASELFVVIKDAYRKLAEPAARTAAATRARGPVVTFTRAQTATAHPPPPPPLPPPLVQPPAPAAARSGLSAEDLFGDLDDPGPTPTAPPAVELEEPGITSEAERLIGAGQYDQAITAYDAALRASPLHRAARVGREIANGLKHVAAGDKFSAAQYFEAALELDPLNEQASRELGAIRRAATDSRKGLLSKLLGEESLMPRIIGIDLGTTNSCVAVLERGAPAVLASREGERTTPSVVAFMPQGGVAVGIPAKRQIVTNADRTVYGAKRLIGRKVNAPDVEKFARVAPFRMVAAPNGDAWIRLAERDVSPQEISSYVLERMRAIAEDNLGEPATQAVVTVPAYFNDAQRQATKDAGKIAGLDVRRILNEPTAAALAYGVHKRKEGRQRIAVFDLGGGTFDVSILQVENGIFEVIAVAGDAALGGDDFDRRIVEKLIEELRARTGIDVGGDPMALGRLKEEAEKAKKALSDEPSTQIQLPFIAKLGTQPVHLERTLSRRELEEWTQDLMARLAPPCEDALRAAGLAAAELDDVLLVGGMTRVPAVQAAVERIFGRKPSKGANPDEVVALGAAAHGAILAGDITDIVLLDVTPHSLGIRVGASFAIVIPRNTTVPAQTKKLFATSQDNQDFVAVEVYQGESKEPRENRHLSRFVLDGLPHGPAGTVKVELSFGVDADGIVAVGARELTTGKETHLTITPAGGLGEDELNRIIEARRAAAAAGARRK